MHTDEISNDKWSKCIHWRGSNGLLLDFIISAHRRQWLFVARLCRAVIRGDMCAVHSGPGFKCCQANCAIARLYLSNNQIGNEGAGSLAEALEATLATHSASSAHTLTFWSCRNSFARFSPKLLHALLTFGTAVFQRCCGRCPLLRCDVPCHRSSRPHVVSVDSVR